MTRVELLDMQAHRALRVRTEPSQVYGDAQHFVRLVVSEFAAAAAHCPILLAKDADTGAFFAGAVFGFDEGENLFLHGNRQTGYRPLAARRAPFFIVGENIAIDLDSPRLSQSEGEPIFEENGSASPFLREVQGTLAQLKKGTEETTEFLREMLRLELVEPIDVTLNFDDGQKRRLDGVYTISADNLRERTDADVLALFRKGYLHLASIVITSLQQISVLARRRNDRLLDGG